MVVSTVLFILCTRRDDCRVWRSGGEIVGDATMRNGIGRGEVDGRGRGKVGDADDGGGFLFERDVIQGSG